MTRVVAKQAKTTNVKNKFVNGKKKFKRILSCLFGGRGKVQFRQKKNKAIKFRRKVQICLVGSARTRLAHRLSSQLFAAVSTPNIAGLMLFVFSVHNNGFYGVPNTFCQEKHQHFHADRQLVTKKEISTKINVENVNKCSWPSGIISGFTRLRTRVRLLARIRFFFFCFFFAFLFNLTT